VMHIPHLGAAYRSSASTAEDDKRILYRTMSRDSIPTQSANVSPPIVSDVRHV
jgi:hypothetical protein